MKKQFLRGALILSSMTLAIIITGAVVTGLIMALGGFGVLLVVLGATFLIGGFIAIEKDIPCQRCKHPKWQHPYCNCGCNRYVHFLDLTVRIP